MTKPTPHGQVPEALRLAASGHIKEPYTLAEVKAKIASNDYSAEMLLQHAMLLLDSAQAAQPAQEAQLNPDMPTQELRLHMGELTTDEVLVARAAIRWANSQQEERVPLTEKQISKLWSDAHNDTSDRMAHQVLVRLVETAHGITAAQKETP